MHRSHEGSDVRSSAPGTRGGRSIGAEGGAQQHVVLKEFGDDDAPLGVEEVVLRRELGRETAELDESCRLEVRARGGERVRFAEALDVGGRLLHEEYGRSRCLAHAECEVEVAVRDLRGDRAQWGDGPREPAAGVDGLRWVGRRASVTTSSAVMSRGNGVDCARRYRAMSRSVSRDPSLRTIPSASYIRDIRGSAGPQQQQARLFRLGQTCDFAEPQTETGATMQLSADIAGLELARSMLAVFDEPWRAPDNAPPPTSQPGVPSPWDSASPPARRQTARAASASHCSHQVPVGRRMATPSARRDPISAVQLRSASSNFRDFAQLQRVPSHLRGVVANARNYTHASGVSDRVGLGVRPTLLCA